MVSRGRPAARGPSQSPPKIATSFLTARPAAHPSSRVRSPSTACQPGNARRFLRAWAGSSTCVLSLELKWMLAVHQTVAYLVLGVTLLSALWGGLAYFRRRNANPILAHLLTLAQTVLVAQVGLGLLLLSDDHRAAHALHYAYGTFALIAALSPWFYAPKEPRKRLAWFSGATLIAAALAVRAYTTA